MKKLLEKLVASIFTVSGLLTSIVILLIVGFLFSEGAGLFRDRIIDPGYDLAVNKSNPVRELSPEQIKAIFDSDLVDWAEVGGDSGPIVPFRLEDADRYFSEAQLGPNYEHAGRLIAELIERTPGIVAFVPGQMLPPDAEIAFIEDRTISFSEIFAGKEWFPTATPSPLFGIVPLVTGTLWVSFFAILFAFPFGIGVSVYLSEIASERTRQLLRPVIELLNGIPSVVYGFFGLVVIVPLLQRVFGLPVGESGLAGSIVLAIMALPTIIAVAEDAMHNCPRAMREASLALGATQWQTIYRVVIPYSISGIASGVVLGIGRAVGETMAVLMVTGNAAVIPTSILEPLRTIPATIAAELGEAPAGGAHYESLFLLGIVLFFITLAINLGVEAISSKSRS